ncbi:uncharacterized protein [Mytilus edulis]|uniref:uncharacterized protein n=1 Tax=Mytilus edulis TaxID=6550 RepID=UPI0039EF7581
MAAWGALQEYVEHNANDETASSDKRTVDTSSTDTHTILGRNRSLRNVVKELQRTFHMYKDTMEELIVKPVMFLEKQTHNDISAAKGQLKESEGILKQAVILLIDGVETMKEAMNKHSRKIDELWNYEECSSELSCDILSIDFQTTTQVQNFIEHHDEIGRFYHVENQKNTEIQKPDKCYICNDIIRENRLMLGISMSYHSNCFRCCTCNKCLDGKPFTLFEGNLYCVDEFYR